VAVLYAEVKTAREIAYEKHKSDRDFYTKALAHIGITVPAGTSELLYLQKTNPITDRQTLEKLRDYYKSLAGTPPTGLSDETEGQKRTRLRGEVKDAASKIPLALQNDVGFFPNELTKVGADNLAATTLEKFKAHVDTIVPISQLEQLLANLKAPR
jgi:hypothetical protein